MYLCAIHFHTCILSDTYYVYNTQWSTSKMVYCIHLFIYFGVRTWLNAFPMSNFRVYHNSLIQCTRYSITTRQHLVLPNGSTRHNDHTNRSHVLILHTLALDTECVFVIDATINYYTPLCFAEIYTLIVSIQTWQRSRLLIPANQHETFTDLAVIPILHLDKRFAALWTCNCVPRKSYLHRSTNIQEWCGADFTSLSLHAMTYKGTLDDRLREETEWGRALPLVWWNTLKRAMTYMYEVQRNPAPT